jgi:hypothetical protein
MLLAALLDCIRPKRSGPSRAYRARVERFLAGDWSERGSGGRLFKLESPEGLVALHLPLVAEHEQRGMGPSFASDAIGRLHDERLVFHGTLSSRRAA